jgi:hypothetical protein
MCLPYIHVFFHHVSAAENETLRQFRNVQSLNLLHQRTFSRLFNGVNTAKGVEDLAYLLPGKIGTSQSFIYGIESLPHQPLQPEYLDCEESAHKQSATGFDSMALDPRSYPLTEHRRKRNVHSGAYIHVFCHHVSAAESETRC